MSKHDKININPSLKEAIEVFDCLIGKYYKFLLGAYYSHCFLSCAYMNINCIVEDNVMNTVIIAFRILGEIISNMAKGSGVIRDEELSQMPYFPLGSVNKDFSSEQIIKTDSYEIFLSKILIEEEQK
jgi:hypothetical protein